MLKKVTRNFEPQIRVVDLISVSRSLFEIGNAFASEVALTSIKTVFQLVIYIPNRWRLSSFSGKFRNDKSSDRCLRRWYIAEKSSF